MVAWPPLLILGAVSGAKILCLFRHLVLLDLLGVRRRTKDLPPPPGDGLWLVWERGCSVGVGAGKRSAAAAGSAGEGVEPHQELIDVTAVSGVASFLLSALFCL